MKGWQLYYCPAGNRPDFSRFPSTCPTSITICTTRSYPCPRDLLLPRPPSISSNRKTSSGGGVIIVMVTLIYFFRPLHTIPRRTPIGGGFRFHIPGFFMLCDFSRFWLSSLQHPKPHTLRVQVPKNHALKPGL